MVTLGKENEKRNFKQFRIDIERNRTPINGRRTYYGRYGGYANDPVAEDFSL